MPTVTRVIPQSTVTIERSMMREAVQQISDNLRFPESKIVWQEYLGNAKSLRNPIRANEEEIRTKYHNYLFVTQENQSDDQRMRRARNIHNRTHRDTFLDADLGVRLRTIYVDEISRLTIRFRTRDLETLKVWTNMIDASQQMQNLVQYVDLRYDYSIPDMFVDFIGYTYTQRELNHGYGESAKDYFAKTMDQGVTTRSNMAGKGVQTIVQESQNRVQGRVDDKFFYKPIEISDGVFEVTAIYTLEYLKPIAMQLYAPNAIHNELLSKEWLEQLVAVSDTGPSSGGQPGDFMSEPVNPKSLIYRGDGGTRLLEWDEWYPKEDRPDLQTLTIVPAQVNTEDYHSLFNLRRLAPDFIDPCVLEYMETFHDSNGNYRRGVIVIELYEVGAEETMLAVTVDKDLNVRSNHAMDPRKRYYVRVARFTDLGGVADTYYEPILAKPSLAESIFQLWDPDVKVVQYKDTVAVGDPASNPSHKQPILVDDKTLVVINGRITEESYRRWIFSLQSTNIYVKTVKRVGVKTVGTYWITAKRS